MAPVSVLAPTPVATLRLAVDAGCRDHAAADALVERVCAWVRAATVGRVPDPAVASTHLVAGPRPRVAVAATWHATPALDTTLAADVLVHAGRELAAAAVVVQTASVRLTSPGRDPGGAWLALAEHEQRRSGRLVRFAGHDRLAGSLTVRQVETTTAVERVEGLMGCEVSPDSVVHLDGWARPTWTDRGCVLLVQRGAQGLMPYEARHQQACCADH
ncbi:hypothetical protein [Nocardioides sp. AX2bis]|uniref:hypothetical protein n=1 Tax=Nocardioides sp. AX2bis TaxID=2653157 RepID=UPI00135ADFFD|nr:hypothetical protein [Nocardioides sp. AX2bis]